VPGGLAARASLWNRRHKLALLLETMRPGPETRVVDVGVGDTGFGTEPGVASSHNFFEALYPWPERITAVSDVPLPNFAREFPMVRCVTASGTDLPFEGDSFDLAFSNAVVEHVGGGMATAFVPSSAGWRRACSSRPRIAGSRSRRTRSFRSFIGSRAPLPTVRSRRSAGTAGSGSTC
jgi:hypothetical protein